MPSFSYAGLSKRLAYLQAALKYLAIATLAWSLPVQLSMACSCAVSNSASSNFISQNKLPANAKGVLYEYLLHSKNIFYVDYWKAKLRPVFLKNNPETFALPQFKLSDADTKQVLKHRIQRIQIHTAPIVKAKSAREEFQYQYLIVSDKNLEACLVYDDTSYHAKRCEIFRAYDESKVTLDELLTKKIVLDVTDRIHDLYGLYRIEPEAGFESGHRYKFERKLAPNYQTDFDYNNLTIKIAAPINLNALNEIRIIADGLANYDKGSFSDCERRPAGVIQNLRYQLPASLEAYKNSLFYLTHTRKTPYFEGLKAYFRGTTVDPHAGYQTIPGHYEACPIELAFSDEGHGIAKHQLKDSDIDYGESQVYDVRGYIGFLEIDEQLRLTPVSKFKLELPWAQYFIDNNHSHQLNKQEALRKSSVLKQQNSRQADD